MRNTLHQAKIYMAVNTSNILCHVSNSSILQSIVCLRDTVCPLEIST